MKIDEKVVSFFESCSSPVDKEGFLYKKGEIKTSYHKRWFSLKGNLLFYKDRPDDREPLGLIVVEGCTVQLCESDEQFAFSLVWNEPGLRTYKFAAEDQESLESWIKSLLSANHGYLALLVMDLEKKYRDALAALPSGSANTFTMPNFHSAEARFPAAHLTLPATALTFSSAPAAAAGADGGAKLALQAPASSPRCASRRSPNLWSKRNHNVAPVNTSAPAGDLSELCSGPKEDFSKLHEDFGKEIKDLISDWSKRGQEGAGVFREDLIDFG